VTDNSRRLAFSADSRHQFATADARLSFAAAAGDTPARLSGYAIVWDQLSTDRGGYRVKLEPGSAKFTTPTLALYEHDFAEVIGNTANNTLRLSLDDVGVKFEIDLPNTTAGRDAAELVEKKYVQGMSFSMIGHPEWTDERIDGMDVMVVKSFTADEITVTARPSFTATTVQRDNHSARRGGAAGDVDHVEQFNRLDQARLDFIAADAPAELGPDADGK
jgi:HK97 family phage prohead protease